MEYIKIANLAIGKYKVNAIIEDKTSYGVLSVSRGVKNDFFLLVAGIANNKNTCTRDGVNIYDNKDYFKNRVYLDFKRKYFRTLNTEYISMTMKNRFGVDFNSEYFKEIVSNTSLRSEVLVTDEYKFTEYGINMCGYCLLKALNFSNVIINNPVHKIRKPELKKQIATYITNKAKFASMIIDVDDPLFYKELIDKYIIFGDYEEAVVCTPETDTFILSDDNVFIRKKIFKRGTLVIGLNEYTRSEMKSFKQKYKIVTFYEMLKYVDGAL